MLLLNKQMSAEFQATSAEGTLYSEAFNFDFRHIFTFLIRPPAKAIPPTAGTGLKFGDFPTSGVWLTGWTREQVLASSMLSTLGIDLW